METNLKQRVVGALVLLALAIIFLPMLFDDKASFSQNMALSSKIPAPPKKPSMETIITLQPPATAHQQLISTKAAMLPSLIKAPSTVAVGDQSRETPAKTSLAPAPQSSVLPKIALKIAKPDVSKIQHEQALAAANAWVVQVGSFVELGKAQALQQQLRQQGFTVFLHKTTLTHQHLARVLVGPVIKRQQALQLQAQLEKSLHISGKLMTFTPGSPSATQAN